MQSCLVGLLPWSAKWNDIEIIFPFVREVLLAFRKTDEERSVYSAYFGFGNLLCGRTHHELSGNLFAEPFSEVFNELQVLSGHREHQRKVIIAHCMKRKTADFGGFDDLNILHA